MLLKHNMVSRNAAEEVTCDIMHTKLCTHESKTTCTAACLGVGRLGGCGEGENGGGQ